ncbi:Mitochondrial import inner membrane translocase subunit Tim17 family protein [Trichomonas vaginalis G3]|uniref:Mitochondrial import inner membrane translocase subunit Tim17 family protein n=1 Tax=Trichomonas vaginalis (strain ATCC PRA-98 / G3) TaxID=412133 RepID=A2DDM1_TRIV3|nr:hypothetical protein TVAGG3_0998770 [Trichomonas vaginalis G3]EAY21397.1 Mitochondrial import inner membrane translocase subunit Tim17 family protein [Trichomonas vaginalis G3]KAI5490610.1 hypothetical protein TVAGG3_0998770 [Trichomonas vaginalis G3]|eukprot:XP_001582383.1 Mitochondrial import inner membrane translocase subunit Tim17 family protein [Trichomonas vaginalis G3]
MIHTALEPDATTVKGLASYLIPITAEEVLYRNAGENPVFQAAKDFATISTGMFVLGTGYSALKNLPVFNHGKPFSVKSTLKEGIQIGVSLGAQAALTNLCETTLAIYRGQQKFYDPIIAGAAVGATLNCYKGFKQMGIGAAKGATLAVFLVTAEAVSDRF